MKGSPAGPPDEDEGSGGLSGVLILVGTPIGNLGDLPPRAREVLASVDAIACEDTRHTGRLLSAAGVKPRRLLAVHDHNETAMVPTVLGLLEAGQRVALVSDAGMPGVSDPGERLVRAVSTAGYPVHVIPGPSAAVAALVVSGLPTRRWCFEGFLPRKGADRAEQLSDIAREARTVVLYEAPHRLAQTLADLARVCGDARKVAVVRELTKVFEETWRGTLGAAAHRAVARDTPAPRGEYVVVVEGAGPPAPIEDGQVVERLAARLTEGLTRKAAVEAVAGDLRLPKRRVYQLSLGLPRSPTAGGPSGDDARPPPA